MIEEIKWDNGSIHKRLIKCPACGTKFDHGAERRSHLLKEHTAEDFNL